MGGSGRAWALQVSEVRFDGVRLPLSGLQAENAWT